MTTSSSISVKTRWSFLKRDSYWYPSFQCRSWEIVIRLIHSLSYTIGYISHFVKRCCFVFFGTPLTRHDVDRGGRILCRRPGTRRRPRPKLPRRAPGAGQPGVCGVPEAPPGLAARAAVSGAERATGGRRGHAAAERGGAWRRLPPMAGATTCWRTFSWTTTRRTPACPKRRRKPKKRCGWPRSRGRRSSRWPSCRCAGRSRSRRSGGCKRSWRRTPATSAPSCSSPTPASRPAWPAGEAGVAAGGGPAR